MKIIGLIRHNSKHGYLPYPPNQLSVRLVVATVRKTVPSGGRLHGKTLPCSKEREKVVVVFDEIQHLIQEMFLHKSRPLYRSATHIPLKPISNILYPKFKI